jgi:DNA polymerase I-like protein with 3'-5' exonuclease and polymerase domains
MAKEKKPKKVAVPKTPNPCLGATIEKRPYKTTHYSASLVFTPSTKQLTKYAEHHKHKLQYNWQVSPPTVTFDTKARDRLLKKYPTDPLYNLLAEYREIEKCKGTYVDGITWNAEGRYSEEFKHTPKTLRLAMRILQLLPRNDDPDPSSLYNMVRAMFVAPKGSRLHSRDFGGIEGKLTAYFSNDPDHYRLTSIDVHSFLASHAIGKPADLSWSDSDLTAYFTDLKARNERHLIASVGLERPYDVIRTACKRAYYLSIYRGGPKRMFEVEPETFGSIKNAKWFQDLIYGTFPAIDKWHWRTAEEAEEKGYITAPSGFRMYYPNGVFEYSFDKEKGKWNRDLGHVAKEVIAARPQHTAFTFSARALALAAKEPDLAPHLRLSIHDEILSEVPVDNITSFDVKLKDIMERPDLSMPLPPEWNQGSHVFVATDAKASDDGGSWASMKKLKREKS